MSNSLPVFAEAIKGRTLHRAIFDIVRKHVEHEKGVRFFLFGSEALGTSWRTSDVDIGLWGPKPISSKTIENVRDDLERLATLRTFDIVDFAHVSEPFRTEALKSVIIPDEQD